MKARWHEAADWLQRLDQNDVSDEELQAWLDWRAQSPDNEQAFEEMQDLFLALREAPAAEKEALRRLAQPDRSNTRLVWALAASALAILVGGTLWWRSSTSSPVYMTARGEHRTISLPDDSRLVLGADSKISLNYSKAERALNLERGEAYFEVKKNTARPFIVQAGVVQVAAVGTAFDVRHSGEHVTVAVSQGVVRVNEGTAPEFRLKAGEKSDVVASSAEVDPSPVVKRVNPETISSWQQGQLQFNGEPLGAVVESVNRYAHRQIVKLEPEVAAMSYTGTVQRERADEWIDNLPQIFSVKKVDLPDGNVVLVKRSD